MELIHSLDGGLPTGLKQEPGIYELVALDKAGKLVPIPRVCGVDRRGVLYIGQTVNLFRRMLRLYRRRHIATVVYSNRPKIRRLAPKLGVRYTPCEALPKDEELKRLTRYVDQFGELPPLNTQAFPSDKIPNALTFRTVRR